MTIYTRTMIETVSGKFVDVADPTPEMFCLEDIAWSLSRMPRYGAHTINKLPYSVGQHSVVVANLVLEAFNDYQSESVRQSLRDHFTDENHGELMASFLERPMPKDLALYGLLHDASEAYLMDLPSPVKQLPGLKEAYLNVEDKLMCQIMKHFDLEWPMPLGTKLLVHWADIHARTIEAYHLMPSRGSWWPAGNKFTLRGVQDFEPPLSSVEAYDDFNRMFVFAKALQDESFSMDRATIDK